MVAEVLKHFSVLAEKLTLPCGVGAACAKIQVPDSRSHPVN